MNALDVPAASTVTWRLWVAPLAWAMHFIAIYGFTAVDCARQGDAGVLDVVAVPWFVLAATIVAAAVLLVTIGYAARDARRAAQVAPADGLRAAPGAYPTELIPWLTAALSSLVLLAVLWETLPIVWVPACG